MFQSPNKKVRIEHDSNETTAARSHNASERIRKETIIHVDSNDRPLQSKRNNDRWCKIFYGEPNEGGDCYNLGKIVLELILDGAEGSEKFTTNFTNVNIAERFPGLDSFRIQVEGLVSDCKNVIDLQTRREISEENASVVLDSSKSKRPLQPDRKYIEMKHFDFAFQKLNIPAALFGKPGKLDTRKIFKIEFEKYDAIYKEIILQVKVYSSAIKGDPSYVEETAPNMADAIPVLDYYFLNKRDEPRMSHSATEYQPNEDAHRFFSLMKEYHLYENRPNPSDTVQDARLMVQLLDYQKEAVVWMLAREGVLNLNDEDNHSTEQLQKLLSMNINKRVNLKAFGNKCDRDAYYLKTSGCLSWDKQPIAKLPNTGGILADEMGLGKTIELLTLILLNPLTNVAALKSYRETDDDVVRIRSFECTCGILDPKDGNTVTCIYCGNSQHANCLGLDEMNEEFASKYSCPQCSAKSPPQPAKSTLIVVPSSLLKQWEEEIENNVTDDSLRVYVYGGFNNGKRYVHPTVLSAHDIVLTTYDILQQEIHFTDLVEETRLRDRKRYAALPSPLMLIKWWRVCLDEAQMVQRVNWQFSKLACMLPAVNRWCVTGTPIPDSLQDLYGIVCFLNIDPITDIKLWKSLIMEPFRLNNSQIAITTNLFGKIFWRTEKEYVQDQLRLPRQTEVIHRLEFSPAERYFYNQRAHYWSDRFKAAVYNVERDQNISTLNATQMLPFRRLRNICTHPQLDEEAFKAVDIFVEDDAKLSFNVFELVDWLIKQALMKLHRAYKMQMIALNDLAGMHLMKSEWENAARQYRRAINLADENKSVLKTEDVNLLHALINMDDAHRKLNLRPNDARVNELIKTLTQTRTNKIALTAYGISRNQQKINFVVDEDAWWIRTIDFIKCDVNAKALQNNLFDALKKTVPVEQMTLKLPAVQLLTDFITNLQGTLTKNLLDIRNKRDEIFANWHALSSTDSIPTYSHLSLLHCDHFSPIPTGSSTNLPPPCRLCSFECKLREYESLLCRSPQKTDFVIGDVRLKSWTESMLNVMHHFAHKNGVPVTILNDGKLHIGQFCDLKNEITELWKWFDQINARTGALQKLLHESKPKAIPAQQNPGCTQMSITEVDKSAQHFKDCLRDLMYLKGLKSYGYKISTLPIDESDPQRCHVHHVKQKWIFLPCNHFFCANCCAENDKDEYSCLVCRNRSMKRTSVVVDMKSNSRHSVTNIPSLEITDEIIWRNPFIKVEAVVRTLLTIKRSHPNDKALVICSCEPMLQVLAAEFIQNDISYILYKIEKKASKRGPWIRFRTDSTQVLLMPLAVASTGLNLTEANHVLLVEPCINLATEEQAIGRIHRLGQRKETFVHKYFVADTIEEKLIRLKDEHKKMPSFVDASMTVQDLLDLIILQSPVQSGNHFF